MSLKIYTDQEIIIPHGPKETNPSRFHHFWWSGGGAEQLKGSMRDIENTENIYRFCMFLYPSLRGCNFANTCRVKIPDMLGYLRAASFYVGVTDFVAELIYRPSLRDICVTLPVHQKSWELSERM